MPRRFAPRPQIRSFQLQTHLFFTGPRKKTNETRYPVPKPKQTFTPHSWQDFTEKNLEWANAQIKNCLALQAQTDTVLAHVASHLRSQKDLCDRAFDRRIEEVKQAKLLLEKQLAETVVKISEMEDSIKNVERGIAAKQVSKQITRVIEADFFCVIL